MFRNYLVTALRNFTRHKLYSFINIAGLTVGLACAIFITLFLRDELSYDTWIPGSGNVYRVETGLNFPGTPKENYATAPFPFGTAMQASIPEIEAAARLVPEDMTVAAGNRQFPETVDFVDPNFFTLIELPLIRGDAARMFAGPESIVLSESMARKYFGNADPLGLMLTVGDGHLVTVTGVLRDPPHNSDFEAQIYISNKSRADQFGDKGAWFSPESYTYVRLLPNADIAAVIAKTRAIIRHNADPSQFIRTNLPADQIVQPRLVPLADIHLEGDEGAHHDAGSWITVYGFAAIAALILAIACFNFTNLATARAMMRAREVSLRKTMGAKRRQLIAQFLGESVLMALLALVLALALVEILLPAFDRFLDRPLVFHYRADWPLLLSIVGVAIAVGLAGGTYPALVLSGFRPAAVLGTASSGMSGSGRLRMALVVLQFAISIGLGIAALVVFAQIGYAQRLDLGFNRDNMVILEGADSLTEAARTSLVHRLEESPDISGVTQSSAAPFNGLYQGTSASVPGGSQDSSMRMMTVTPDFFPVYGIKLLAGRFLSVDRGADVGGAGNGYSSDIDAGKNILVNAAAAWKLGFTPQEAIGQVARIGTVHTSARIVGVVDNAKFYGARGSIDPTVYIDRLNQFYVISVRMKGGHIPEALDFIDKTWRRFAPNVAIRRHFLDDSFDMQLAADKRQGTMFGLFVGIAIFIACLGLFGLAAFTAERRTKEIGIRKAFGARTPDIVRLLLWQFSIPVLIANAIAWPIAYYYLHGWLESYAYRITLSPVYFFAAGLVALLTAWATVIVHAVRVARANPVHALRYE